MKILPKVTVITVARNAAATIGNTMDSVLAQDYSNLEYILIDGASSDDTLAIVRSYGDRISKLISEKDAGLYDGMQKGIDLATGKMILLMNAGDSFAGPSALSSLVGARVAVEMTSPIICYADYIKEYPSLGISVVIHPVDDLHRGMGLCHQAMLIDKSVYDHIGGFDQRYRFGADHDWSVRAKQRGIVFLKATIPPPVIFRHGGLSDSKYWASRMEGALIIRKAYGIRAYTKFMARQYWVSALRSVSHLASRLIGESAVKKMQSVYLTVVRRQRELL